MRPWESRTGETVTDTSINAPSLRRRIVSKLSMISPETTVARMRSSSAWRSSGMMVRIERLIISSSEKPKMRSALLFQLVMVPSRVLLTTPSDDEATMAASMAAPRSAFLVKVTSRMIAEMPTTAACGLRTGE